MKKILLVLAILALTFTLSFAAAVDEFSGKASGLTSPATTFYTMTPSDTEEVVYVPRGIQTEGSCDLVMKGIGANSETVTLTTSVGTLYPYRIKNLYNTTTCTSVIGMY